MGNDESKVSEQGLKYKPLKTRKNQIRIIKFEQRRPEEPQLLNLSLHTVSLDKKPVYNCLSYVWGKPEFIWPVYVNDSLVHITPTLGQALNQLEHENLKALWADGICINQRDMAEREDQVKLMSRVYSECQANFAWLGMGDEKLYAAMHLLNTTGVRVFRSLTIGYLDYILDAYQKLGSDDVDSETQNQVIRFRDAIKLADDHDTRDAFAIDANYGMLERKSIADILDVIHLGEEAYFQMRDELFLPAATTYEAIITTWEGLMDRPFWRRIWIVQELIQPDVVILRCGSSSARLEYLHGIRNFVQIAGHTKQDPIPGVEDFLARFMRLHKCLTNPANSLHLIASMRQSKFSDFKAVESWDTIHVMLRQCWQLESTIDLDKVYGLMNVSSDVEELRELLSYNKTMGQLGMEVMRMTLIRHGLKHFQEGFSFYYPMNPEVPPDETDYTVLNPYWPSWMNIADGLYRYPGASGPLFLIHQGRSEIVIKQFRASKTYSHKVSACDFGPSNSKWPVNDVLRVPCRIIGEVKRVCDLSIRTWSKDIEDYEMAQLAMGHDIIKEVELFFDQENDLESMLYGKPLWWLFSLQPDVPSSNPVATASWRENMESYQEQFLALKNKTPHPAKCTPHRAILIKWIQAYSPLAIDTGYVGLGPRQSLEGDKVVIFPDVDVPYVLRPGEGGFKILGQAYILGIMNGEFLGTDPPESFVRLM